jgi:hypothetical protein
VAHRDLPPVTVLLPVYNGGSHLAGAVRSVLAQDYPRFELLIINDGSTDETTTDLAALDDSRVRVLHQPNRGLVASLNRGLHEARYDLIARMDADDLSAPRRLSVQVDFMMKVRQVAAVGSCFIVIDEAGAELDEVHVAADPAYLGRSMYFRNAFAHGSMMFRRDCVLEVGGYRNVGPCEDYDLWVRLLRSYSLGNVPDLLYRYRVSASQISSASRQEQTGCFQRARKELHSTRPLPRATPRALALEGLQHVSSYPQCRRTAQSYAYDHFGLARLMMRAGRYGQALELLLGVMLFALRKPRAFVGLPPLQSLAQALHRLRRNRRG